MLLLGLLIWLAAEIVAFVVVAQHIGVLLAVLLIIVVSAAGPFLVRRAGTGVVEQARRRIQRGEAPDRELLDGVVLLLGGALVCIPGFVGDAVGLVLLFGPARHLVIRTIGHHLARRIGAASAGGLGGLGGMVRGRSGRGGTVVDASTHDEPPDDDPPRRDAGADGRPGPGSLPGGRSPEAS